MLDQDYLKELFEYKDGELYWKVKPANKVFIGDKAGTTNKKAGTTNRYAVVGINGKRRYKHKIIFIMVHGYSPIEIDFIDNNPANCRIENLRAATRSDAVCNSRKRKNNTSGYKGVSWDIRKNKWVSYIMKNQKRIHLGYFKDIKKAYEVYCIAAKKYHGEFAKLN